MSKPWVVICGVVRDVAHFSGQLEALKRWKADGFIEEIVFSTWIGEVDNYPSVIEARDRGDFVLVESRPPILRTVGHTLHQARTLYYALQAVPDGVRVLKVRPDIALVTDAIRDTLEDVELNLEPVEGWPDVFGAKICVITYCMDTPLYINDIVYYGYREDLLKLASFDLSTEYLCNVPAPEQFFFRGPFAGRFGLLEAFFQVAPNFQFNDPAAARDRLEIMLSSDVFLDVLALSSRLMRHYFRVGFVPDLIRANMAPVEDGFSLGAMLLDGAVSGTEFHASFGGVNLFEERALDAILQGRFARDELGVRMAAALNRTADPEYWSRYSDNPLRPTAEIRALSDALRARLRGLGGRLAQVGEGGRSYRIEGPTDRVALMVQTDDARRQAEEINYLRRLVDELQAKAGRG